MPAKKKVTLQTKDAQRAEASTRYIYSPHFTLVRGDPMYKFCLFRLENCGHQWWGEPAPPQNQFKLAVDSDGGCPGCSMLIQGHFICEMYVTVAPEVEAAIESGSF